MGSGQALVHQRLRDRWRLQNAGIGQGSGEEEYSRSIFWDTREARLLLFEVNEAWCSEIKIVKLIFLFVMVSRGHSAKKKKDTVNSQTREESKDPKGDEAMDGQANIIRNERPDE